MSEIYSKMIEDEASALKGLLCDHDGISTQLMPIMEQLFEIVRNKKRIYVCGNGGSAAQAQHFTAELLGKYGKLREPVDIVCLNDDTAFITAWSNDCSYSTIFSRQLEAYGNPCDLFMCFTTSGMSPNIVEAMKVASLKGMAVILFTGNNYTSDCAKLSHLAFHVDSSSTPHIQEMHLFAIHMMCGILEEECF